VYYIIIAYWKILRRASVQAIEAVAFGGPEVLEVRHFPAPVAGAGEVVIDVAVAPVLFLDTQIRAGLWRDWFPARPPYVPGRGVAGTVGWVGTGVEPTWAGRRVVADTPAGGYLEQAVVPAGRLIPVPDGVGLADAAALLHDGRTALALVEATAPRAGEWILVTGAAGGLGLLLVQLAHQAGARVIGAARGEKKLALAAESGADAVVDYSQPEWAGQAARITGGAGPSLVLDGVGGDIGRAAFDVVADGGRFSAHGTPGGGFAPISPTDASERGISVLGIDRVQLDAAEVTRLTSLALSEAAAGRMRPVVGQAFSLDRAADAHRAIESRAVLGKTLLEV
jgi:NADPH:quinone reductase